MTDEINADGIINASTDRPDQAARPSGQRGGAETAGELLRQSHGSRRGS